MTNKLNALMNDKLHQDYAIESGVAMHVRMQNIFFDADGNASGDTDIIAKISNNKELVEYMGPLSRTEVPIAGYIGGRFVSCRVDRLYLNEQTKQIVVVDYKTDIDKERFRRKYIDQLTEYHKLLCDAYPEFTVRGFILWTNDFKLENII